MRAVLISDLIGASLMIVFASLQTTHSPPPVVVLLFLSCKVTSAKATPRTHTGMFFLHNWHRQARALTQLLDYCSSYLEQRAALDAAIKSGAVSAATASDYCNSQAHSFDVAAKASFLGFGASGGSTTTDSSENCGSASSSSSADSYSSSLDQSAFNLAITNIMAYQASSCGSSNDLSSNSQSVQSLQSIIE